MIPTAVLSTLATVLLLAAPSLRAAPPADGKAVEADWILDRLASSSCANRSC